MDRKEISIAPGFFVDRNGNVYDRQGVSRTKYLNGDGYEGVSLKTIAGVWVTFGVQRLVANAFIPNPRIDRIEVNHRDGIKTNNRVDNLEWVTSSENNIHSEISRNNNEYVTLVMHRDNTPVGRFKNWHDASNATGDNQWSPLDVWDSVKDGLERNGLRFYFQSRQNLIPTELKTNHFRTLNLKELGIAPPARPVKVMDIDTGEIQTFDSVSQAAKAFNVATSQISKAVPLHGELRVFKEKYRLEQADREFIPFTREEIQEKRFGPRDVIAYNTRDNKYHLYESARRFILENKLSMKTVTTVLKKGTLKVIDGWIMIYLTESNSIALKKFVEGLDSTNP